MQYGRLCYNNGFGDIWYWVVFTNTAVFNEVRKTLLPFRWYVEKHTPSKISEKEKRAIQQTHNFDSVAALLGFIQKVENFWEQHRQY